MPEVSQNSQAFKAANMKTYLHDVMPDDMKAFVEGGKTKTGYDNLDAITNLYPGLYVIGAISSLGKTTFIHQMADQLAKNGQPVLFFSLEQSTLELATKSLSRIMAIKDESNAMTSLQIRKNGSDPRVADAVTEYDAYSGNLTVVECTFRATIDDITNYVTNYIKQRNVSPVVIVDYLQVIQTAPDSRMTTKDAVDLHVWRLKQLQSDNKLALIVISSLNRQNYLTQIDYESFKESGGIEYTADVVWGLQLQVLHDEIFDSQAKINEKRQKVRDAKAANPRKIELVCLKNRFGISSYSLCFDYLPQFDLFKPDMSNIDMSAMDAEADKDGFITVPDGWENPFEQMELPTDRKSF